MDRRKFLNLFTRAALATSGASCVGCGSIFYSDRVGMPHSRDIDWQVAALDGLGLAFFFVPGVIAFAVDFYTGAIYLPHEQAMAPPPPPTHGVNSNPPMGNGQASHMPTPPPAYHPNQTRPPLNGTAPDQAFHKIGLAPRDLSQQSIEAAISRHLGRPIELASSQVRMSSLTDLSRFDQARLNHEAKPTFGYSAAGYFEREKST